MRNVTNFLRTAMLLLTALCWLPALAADDVLDVDKARITGERPDAGGPPVQIKVAAYLLDIDNIDDAQQRFNIDMFLKISWQDDRLALSKRKREGLTRTVPLDSIWFPRGIIMNARGVTPSLPRMADIDDLGNVLYVQRITGALATDFAFNSFPFDTQYLPVDIVSYTNTVQDIQFTADSELLQLGKTLSAPGWNLTILKPKLGEYSIPGTKRARPRIVYVIGAERDASYYLLTLFVPMSLIILMAWSVFWLPPDIIPARIGVSTAAIFSFVAFGFSIRSRLPEVSYMTVADYFVMGCTLLVFIALGIVVWGSRLANSERLDQALRISAVTRWVYLLLFIGLAYWSLT